MPRSHCVVSLLVSPHSSGTWRNIIHTVWSVLRTVSNGTQWQEAGSVPVCIAPINTNMMKRGRGVKRSANRSQTELT